MPRNDAEGPLAGGDVEAAVIRVTFPLGTLVATPGALEALRRASQRMEAFVARHAARDWGDISEGDRAANDADADGGGTLLSAYDLAGGGRIWVITEHDRSVTTVLLPTDY